MHEALGDAEQEDDPDCDAEDVRGDVFSYASDVLACCVHGVFGEGIEEVVDLGLLVGLV